MIFKKMSHFKMFLKLTALTLLSREWLKKAKNGGKNSKMAGLSRKLFQNA